MSSHTNLCEFLESRVFLAGDLIHTTALLSQPRESIKTAVIGNDVFFISGIRNARRGYTSAALDIYNAHTHRWYSSVLPAGFPSGKITVAGKDLISTLPFPGNTSDTVQVYDTTTGNLTTHAINHGDESIAVVGSKVLFTGGRTLMLTENFFSNAVDVYDTTTGNWSSATLNTARQPGATAVIDDQALFIGAVPGFEHGGIPADTTDIDIYNATTDLWSTASLTLPSSASSVATLDHQAVIAGGQYGVPPAITFDGTAYPSSAVDIYHADTGQVTHATLSLARKDIASAVVGHTAVFAGGDYFIHVGRNRDYPQSAVDLYNSQTGQLTTASLSVPRDNAKSVVVGNTALFFGGFTIVGRARPTTVDIYNNQTGHFSVTTMPNVMPSASAVTVGNDVIFYTDGSSTLDVYNVPTSTWSVTSLSSARSAVAATSIGNQALFAGGATAHGLSTTVDLYTAPVSAARAAVFSNKKLNAWD